MPNPQKGETLSEFVGKYMSSKPAQKRFPKRSQRAADSEGREAKLKK